MCCLKYSDSLQWWRGVRLVDSPGRRSPCASLQRSFHWVVEEKTTPSLNASPSKSAVQCAVFLCFLVLVVVQFIFLQGRTNNCFCCWIIYRFFFCWFVTINFSSISPSFNIKYSDESDSNTEITLQHSRGHTGVRKTALSLFTDSFWSRI